MLDKHTIRARNLIAFPLLGAIVVSICLLVPQLIYGVRGFPQWTMVILALIFFIPAATTFVYIALSIRDGIVLEISPWGKRDIVRDRLSISFWCWIATYLFLGAISLVLSISCFLYD